MLIPLKEQLRRMLAITLISLAPLFYGQVVYGQIQDHTPDTGKNPELHIVVHADRPAASEIPSTIFGSFLEPIGRSIYGGLWAELIENGSLEDGLWSASEVARMVQEQPELLRGSQLGLPLPWEPLVSSQGNRYEPRWGDAANSSRSLEIMALPTGEAGICQRIYLPVQRTLEYDGSIWVKHLSGPTVVSVSIRKRDAGDQILAETKVDAGGPDWTRYTYHLTLKPGDVYRLEPVYFVVSLSNDARALVDEISLMPADNIDGMDPDVIQMARDLKPSVIRFGGNFTSGYHWRDGIGPRDKRVSMLNLAWGIPEYNTFGTDEFLRFCELVHAQPQIALNLGTGTPEEAANWVRYVDEHWDNKKGGLLWELGNELWGNWNTGYPARDQIGDRTRIFSEAIRKLDPRARLIATGADPDNFQEWNAVQLSNPPGTFNYLSTHFVVGVDQAQLRGPSNGFIAEAAFAMPVGLAKRLGEMTQQIQQSGHHDTKIAFTEWLFIGHQFGAHAAPDFTNMGGGVITGGFLNMLLDHSDIVPISDMTGILEFAGIWKRREQVYAAPGYWVLRTYAEAAPQRLLAVDSDAPTYSVEHGVNRVPEIQDVPWLDVRAAVLANGNLALFCINRSLERDFHAAISLQGFEPAHEATAKIISAPSIYDRNDEDNPDAVGVTSNQLPAGKSTSYIFPHASVVVLEFQRSSAH
jgi:alpha-N-arabinofuranosidase